MLSSPPSKPQPLFGYSSASSHGASSMAMSAGATSSGATSSGAGASANSGAHAAASKFIPSFLAAAPPPPAELLGRGAREPAHGSRSPALFQNTLPAPVAFARHPSDSNNPSSNANSNSSSSAFGHATTPPATHSQLGISASVFGGQLAHSSSDDYGMDYGSPSSPKSRASSFKSGSGATPNYSDAPPMGSLFDMTQFGSLANTVGPAGSSSWSPNMSRNSSAMGTPVLRHLQHRPSGSTLSGQPLLPTGSSLSTSFTNNVNPSQLQTQSSTSVRVLGFSPHQANALISHFESLSTHPVTVHYHSGTNHMVLTYSDTLGFERALKECDRVLDNGSMIDVRPAPTPTVEQHLQHQQQHQFSQNHASTNAAGFNGTSIRSPGTSEYRNGFSSNGAVSEPFGLGHHQHHHHKSNNDKQSPAGFVGGSPVKAFGNVESITHNNNTSSPTRLHPHGLHPYSRTSRAGSPTKLNFGNAGSPQRRLRGVGGANFGGSSPDRVSSGGVRRVQANHSSGSVFARGGNVGGGQNHQGNGVVRPASVWSQVMNTVFGW
ncbi:hypothetical protein BDR26DRAFT_852200 [Obelidium mucronatum]|nr:hypothetical protein BDR26DRAFT_852200 [Obelidium mucronatum]